MKPKPTTLRPLALLGLLFMLLTACSNDSEDDVIGDIGDENNGTTVTYDANIDALISGKCLGCHETTPTNGAPFSLTTYESVQSRSTAILGSIQGIGGFSQMPPGNPLSTQEIQLVSQWIEDGLLEN